VKIEEKTVGDGEGGGGKSRGETMEESARQLVASGVPPMGDL